MAPRKRKSDLRVARSATALAAPLELRPYTITDREVCQRIAGSSTDYAHAIDANADAIEVAEVGGKVVGFAYIQVWRWNRVAWLCDIVVEEEHRSRGIGRALLRRMEGCALDLGCRVIMDHPPVNHPAVSYYLRNGFRICGYNDRFYADLSEPTAIYVCKELG